ncbi:hypothetical protein D6833_03330 [Candidatus Parcubacteria bacterium]|nr:MAG: hypothetical protein D6833_03330 [Candidatus Parcubacteria bacterium]
MKPLIRDLTLTLTGGYLLTFYSEFLFYGQLNEPGTPPPTVFDLLLLWAVYALMAYILMALIRCYRVASVPALLVVGAAYGWMLEGGIVATVYEELPWSLSFTALAWHMPIDVLFGWYLVPKWLRERDFAFNLRASALTGLLWGFWAVWPAQVTPLRPAWFTGFAFVSVGLLLAAYWLMDRLGLSTFQPRRVGMMLAGVLFLGWYLLNTAFAVPRSLLILPALLALCGWALRRNARIETTPDLLEQFGAPARPLASPPFTVRPVNLLAWLAFPALAAGEYAFWATIGWQVPSNIVGYLVTVPLGFGLFAWALWKIGRASF